MIWFCLLAVFEFGFNLVVCICYLGGPVAFVACLCFGFGCG